MDTDSTAFPPEGWLNRRGAAALFGISTTQLCEWIRLGRLKCTGKMVGIRGGGVMRIWPIDELEQARAAMANPAGYVSTAEAIRVFDVSQQTWTCWTREGVVPKARVGHGENGKRILLFPLEELKQIKAKMDRRYEPYADPNRPGVVRVPLASGKYKGVEALIDAADLPVVQGTRWNFSGGHGDDDDGRNSVMSPKIGTMARLILNVTDPEMLVVHVNGDKRDCRRENLVLRTRSEVGKSRKGPKKWEGLLPYPDPECAGVVRVPVLSDKHKGMEALIDAGDLPLIEGKRWNWTPGKPDPAKDGSVILAMAGTPKPSLPRILLGIDGAEQLVCHVNGNRLDCRRVNLIVRTRVQVRVASKKSLSKAGRLCSSRFKGVTRTDSGRKWQATINVGGQHQNLGRFRSEIDAALAYDAALREVMGADVVGLNLPDLEEAQRMRASEPIVEDGPFPPPGMVDRHEACAMFGVSLTAWMVWEKKGRITCGQYHPLPNDQPGRCKLYPRNELERARVEIEKLGKPYPDPDRLGVWRVPLRSYLAHREALIDETDLAIVEGRNWNWSDRTDGRVEGNVVLASVIEQIPLHRMIMAVHGTDARLRFINGDPLDCRRANLAVLTLAEQVRGNRKMGSVSGRKYTSTFKGVCWDEPRGKWLVQIRKGQVYTHVGRFDDEIDAATAYDAAARVLFGEHGHLNFPDQASTDQAMKDARAALDSDINKQRAQRRRQRDVERRLRKAAIDVTQADQLARDDTAIISRETVRQLFDVTSPIWERWQSFGWLPAGVSVEGGQIMYRLGEIKRLLSRCGLVVLPYRDPQRPGVYRVPLNGETAQGREALIDADAVPLVQTRRWRFAATDAGRGGEVQTMIPSENIRLHYVVMGMTGDKEVHVGHRNDDPLDCRRENLVVRTLTDTAANKRKQPTWNGRPCTSRFKGVCKPKKSKRWVVSIKKNRVQRRLGTFHDEIAAAQAYDEAAREWFGEHARLNFPDGIDAYLEREARETEQRAAA